MLTDSTKRSFPKIPFKPSQPMNQKYLALISATFVIGGLSQAAVIATDNFENNNPGTAYNDGISYGDNGGSGFGALTYLQGNGGGLFNATLSGSRALGIFAGGGGGNTQALGRTISSSTTSGVLTFQLRFDLANDVAFSGINIKSALGSAPSGFGTSELLSLGLTPSTGNNSIFIGGSVNTTIPLGVELRGVNLDFSVDFNTDTGAYIVGAKRTSDSLFTTVSGTLKDTNGGAAGVGAVSAIGFGNFNTGNNQNLIVDNLTLVPEPTSAALGLIGSLLLLRRRR